LAPNYIIVRGGMLPLAVVTASHDLFIHWEKNLGQFDSIDDSCSCRKKYPHRGQFANL